MIAQRINLIKIAPSSESHPMKIEWAWSKNKYSEYYIFIFDLFHISRITVNIDVSIL